MEFKSIYISNPARLTVRREQLVITQDSEVTIPMEDITSLLVESCQISITSAALQKLAEYEVTVYFCNEQHLPSALLLPLNSHCRQLKVLQAQIALTKPRQKQLWQQVVAAKIRNQAKCLELVQNHNYLYLRTLAKKVRPGDPDNLEAMAAAFYFPNLFGVNFTRELPCLANSALNYGYSIVRGAVARNLVTRGLEPCLGIFHHNQLNQFNLADDFMEPLRPLVDLFVASKLKDEDKELTPTIKKELFNLTNYMLQQGTKRYRLISVIGKMADSFKRALTDRTEILELPELISLESYKYE